MVRRLKMFRELSASQVDNEVVWVNPDFPKLKAALLGKPTPLAFFLNRVGKSKLENIASHERVCLVARALIRDKDGNVYRDIDVKGMGYAYCKFDDEKKSFVVEILNPKTRAGGETEGLLDLETAAKEHKINEQFKKWGIRTVPHLMHVRLKQIIDEDGHKISIKRARARHMINPDTRVPGLIMRAYGTMVRVCDIGDDRVASTAERKEALEDAIELLKKEGELNSDDIKEYARWFQKTLAEQTAKIHNHGRFHSNLHSGNVTLDCRILDLDTVLKFNPQALKRHLSDDNVFGPPDDFNCEPELFNSLNELLKIPTAEGDEFYEELATIYYNTYSKTVENPVLKKEAHKFLEVSLVTA